MPEKNHTLLPTGGGITTLKVVKKCWKFGHLKGFKDKLRFPKKSTHGEKVSKTGITPYLWQIAIAKKCIKAYNWLWESNKCSSGH
jgi:hypothetical protein